MHCDDEGRDFTRPVVGVVVVRVGAVDVVGGVVLQGFGNGAVVGAVGGVEITVGCVLPPPDIVDANPSSIGAWI